MKTWKKITGIILSCTMMAIGQPVMATESQTEASNEALEESGQLTLEALDALNGGSGHVYSHNGRVTFVDGTCTEGLVTTMEEATAVLDSVMSLIGADDNTAFTPWREVTDPLGNHTFIFQQTYHDTTVCGGAVKVITDPEGHMIGLSSSVESEMPEVGSTEGITAEEAEQIVLDAQYQATGCRLEVLDSFTGTAILPTVLVYDINGEDESSRFVWVVYTTNPTETDASRSDLPYLAHYVSMAGEYLYNMPTILPDDAAGRAGYDASYIFEFMESVPYTGYVDLSNGSEKEISVDVMRDTRTGMYYLGNLERKIVVGQCYDFLYGGGKVVLEYSPDNREWDQTGLLSLYNYCRAWDYYHEIGWDGGDGLNTPILILNNFCDDHHHEVNNACYVGKVYGMQCFLASKINDFSQCLDVIAHEFTHCVTGSLMTYNSYMNDYGAINEAMSDIQGKNCDQMYGDVTEDDWILGSNSLAKFRSMSDPHDFSQPEHTWDLYYNAKVKTPTPVNDYGGVHSNSSLLNYIAYLLRTEGGMTMEEARIFWFLTDCAMVPQTDYAQLADLLPWVLKTARMDQYGETLKNALEKTRLGEESLPEAMEEDRALIVMSLPDTETFDTGNWVLTFTSVDVPHLVSQLMSLGAQLSAGDYSSFPEDMRLLLEEAQAEADKYKDQTFLEKLRVVVIEALHNLASQEEDSKVVRQQEKEVLLDWARHQLQELVFSSHGAAGQDGSTLHMVVRPGRAIPVLMHATVQQGSDEPDQLLMLIHVNGKWLALPRIDDPIAQDFRDEFQKALLGEGLETLEKIRSLEDVLNLFSVKVPGGEVVELSAEGLDQLVIPEPTAPEDKVEGTIVPGPKSRPKTEEAEPAAEAETAVEAETAAEAEEVA